MNYDLEAFKEYNKKLNKCKEKRKKYILVNTGKEIIENFNVKNLPKFNGYKDPYVNETLKFMQLIRDLDIVNENIIESHELWEKIRVANAEDIDFSIYNTYYHTRFRKLHEYIVHDLKHFIDETIATVSIIRGYIKDNKVAVSSIGAYLAKKEPNYNDFDDFADLFEKIDDLSNSYKHSYACSDFEAIGVNEDCFTSLYSKYNDFNRDIEVYSISMDYIITEFNRFYTFTFDLIDTLTKNIII